MVEWWNNGFWENGVMVYWQKLSLQENQERGNCLSKSTFQYSTIPSFRREAKIQASRKLIHSIGCRNSETCIISRKKLRGFWEQHPDALRSLEAWYADTKQADWNTPTDIKSIYSNASFVANNRVVFNIKGDKYRLVAAIRYEYKIVYIRFVGTHREYDKIDAATI